MKDKQGWIKLSRKLLDNPIFQKPDYLVVWLYLLLNASHKETFFIWNNKKQILKEGQLLTGRKKIAQKTKVAESQVYKILKYLELEQQIEQQKTTKFTIITIINWNTYQHEEQQKEQQSNNRVTTEEQQSNTYKNVKNVKNDNNIYKELATLPYKKELSTIVDTYNQWFNKNLTSTKGFEKNYMYWKDIHSLNKIQKAIENASKDKFWRDKMTLTILFRRKNSNKEDVDYIEDLYSRKPNTGGDIIII